MTEKSPAEQANQEAAALALQAGIEEIMAAAADGEIGSDMLADLLAHELVALHRLMLRLSAASHQLLCAAEEAIIADRAAGKPDPDTAATDLAAAGLVGVGSRLMETMRQGLVALVRCRPEVAGEGVWIALSWLDGRCSDEELQRRLAEAKAQRAANEPPRAAPSLSPRARELRALADDAALLLAEQAGVKSMAGLAADERLGRAFLLRLFAHELGAGHGLMMRLASAADRAFDRAVEAREEPVAALRLSGVVARLGDRFRRGMLTLHRLPGGPGGGPEKVAGYVWGGRGNGGYKPGVPAAPANDALDPAAVPAASAGHGVHHRNSPSAAVVALRRPAAADPASPAGHGVHRPNSRRCA